MPKNEIEQLAYERLTVTTGNGSACILCGEPVHKYALDLKVKFPVVGLQSKHMHPFPCGEIFHRAIGHRLGEVASNS